MQLTDHLFSICYLDSVWPIKMPKQWFPKACSMVVPPGPILGPLSMIINGVWLTLDCWYRPKTVCPVFTSWSMLTIMQKIKTNSSTSLFQHFNYERVKIEQVLWPEASACVNPQFCLHYSALARCVFFYTLIPEWTSPDQISGFWGGRKLSCQRYKIHISTCFCKLMDTLQKTKQNKKHNKHKAVSRRKKWNCEFWYFLRNICQYIFINTSKDSITDSSFNLQAVLCKFSNVTCKWKKKQSSVSQNIHTQKNISLSWVRCQCLDM